MTTSFLALALALCTAVLPSMANAETIGGTTTGGPTWNRPLEGTPPVGLSGTGTAVPYSVTPLTVDTTGTYTFQSTATGGWDNYSFLYQVSFDPNTPLFLALIGNDDNPDIGLSGFSILLTTGTNYFFVETGFLNSDFGAYSLTVTGPDGSLGHVTFNTPGVPEPTTWAMMLFGFGGIGIAMRRNRRGRRAQLQIA